MSDETNRTMIEEKFGEIVEFPRKCHEFKSPLGTDARVLILLWGDQTPETFQRLRELITLAERSLCPGAPAATLELELNTRSKK